MRTSLQPRVFVVLMVLTTLSVITYQIRAVTPENLSGPGLIGASQSNDAILGVSQANGRAGVAGVSRCENGNGLYGRSEGNGSGCYGVSLGKGIGVIGSNEATGIGVLGKARDGQGVVGESQQNDGVLGVSEGLERAGVAGVSRCENGNGLYGRSEGNGNGSYAVSLGTGTGAIGSNEGTGTGVLGKARVGRGVVGESQQNDGVLGVSEGRERAGVAGVGRGERSNGLYGRSEGNGNGVFASADREGNGVSAHATGSGYGVIGQSVSGTGIHGFTQAEDRPGIYAENQGNGTGLVARGRVGAVIETDHGVALKVVSDVAPLSDAGSPILEVFASRIRKVFSVSNAGQVTGQKFSTDGGDVAEIVDLSEPATAAQVIEIDPDQPGKFRCTQQANSTLVAGVLATNPGLVLRSGHDELTQDANLLALTGRVPVQATCENGEINPGDLLVSSSTRGCAMKAPAQPVAGTVIGKSLGTLLHDSGSVTMLIMLR